MSVGLHFGINTPAREPDCDSTHRSRAPVGQSAFNDELGANHLDGCIGAWNPASPAAFRSAGAPGAACMSVLQVQDGAASFLVRRQPLRIRAPRLRQALPQLAPDVRSQGLTLV